jgi:hypothetical protein
VHSPSSLADRARYIRDHLPVTGLFSGQEFRISPDPFPLDRSTLVEIEKLGRILLQFQRAANLLYRQSVAGKQPGWIAEWLDQGKPAELIELQRSPALKNELPRVIRPDLLLTETGLAITELDSVPGGIGLTAWLNSTYAQLPDDRTPLNPSKSTHDLHSVRAPAEQYSPTPGQTEGPPYCKIVGGEDGMLQGFAQIFQSKSVHIVVSEESATYRPEMEWLAKQIGGDRFHVRDSKFANFLPDDAVYRFFELFDLPNIQNATQIFRLAVEKQIQLTPPPKTFLEEKMLFALLWNRNLRGFWRQELGESFLDRLQQLVPYTWVVHPDPLPPHAGIPGLDITDWHQLKTLSQRERNLILKVSGFSESAWGARGVYLGSDLSVAEWSAAVDQALTGFARSPYILQRYDKPRTVQGMSWFDFQSHQLTAMPGRVRLCPYYFVIGDADSARAELGGILATICPADKKIIHGMKDAILAPCSV